MGAFITVGPKHVSCEVRYDRQYREDEHQFYTNSVGDVLIIIVLGASLFVYLGRMWSKGTS